VVAAEAPTTLARSVSPVRRAVGILFALAALAAAGCGDGGTASAAKVDGATITNGEVVDELHAIEHNRGFVGAIEQSGVDVLGSSEGSFDAAFVATQLGVRIQYQLVHNEVRRRHLDVGDDCRQAAQRSVEQRVAPASPDGDGAAVLGDVPAADRQYLVDREADVVALQGDLVGQPCVTDAAVEAYFEAHRDDFEQACASHILVATQAEADDVVRELAAGGDFAALAAQRSIDTGSAQQGGSLGCVTKGTTLPELDAALFSQPLGQIGPPVQTQAGFHVLRVDSRQVPELDAVRDDVAQALSSQVRDAFGSWFRDAVSSADVEVDARYGCWDASQATVVRDGSGQGCSAVTTTTAPPPSTPTTAAGG
jgi:foldase protein PrsA